MARKKQQKGHSSNTENGQTKQPLDRFLWKDGIRRITYYEPWSYLKEHRVTLTQEERTEILNWGEKSYDVDPLPSGLDTAMGRLSHRSSDVADKLAKDMPAITAYFQGRAHKSFLDQLKYDAWCEMVEGLDDFSIYREEYGQEYYDKYRDARTLV